MHKCSFVIKIDFYETLALLESLFNELEHCKERPEIPEECYWFAQKRPLGTKVRVTLEELPNVIESFDAIVRIKEGASITQNRTFLRWPHCFPPRCESLSTENPYCAKDQSMLFCGHWNGKFWNCVADGYGNISHEGDYGSGCIFVHHYDDVEIVDG